MQALYETESLQIEEKLIFNHSVNVIFFHEKKNV